MFSFSDDADPATAALPFVDDELLIQHFPGVEVAARAAALEEIGATLIEEFAELNLLRIRITSGTLGNRASRLMSGDLFERVHKNYVLESQIVPNDSSYVSQPHLPQINAPMAWDVSTGSPTIIIAVVDSGVERGHPDLSDKIIDGWNVRANSSDYTDAKGHGTLVAGVAAAASNNGVGIAGVAWQSPILAVRVSDDAGQATARDVTAGILWAVNHGAKVINVSFAPLWSNSLVQSAATLAYNRGAIVVISAGNGGGTTTAAGYEQALFVGAIDGMNALATFSDRGTFVDLVAPGRAIYSTAIGGGYRAADGTSFAAPIVSGVIALAWSSNADLRPTTIMQIVKESTRDLGGTGYDATFAGGAVDAYRAVTLARETAFVSDSRPPTVRITSPQDGATLTRLARVVVSATDDWGVADVSLAVDQIPVAVDDRAPYEFSIDTASYSAGTHELSIAATDISGNASVTQRIKVSFSSIGSTGALGRTSVIQFRSPTAGATVTGDVLIDATVGDLDGLAAVEWWIDGAPVLTSAVLGTSSGVSYLWRGAGVTRGEHTITINVVDAVGNRQSANLILSR